MNAKDFNTQMRRLKNTYGDHAYKQDRMKILWDTVRHQNPDWFRRQVDFWIGMMRNPPLQKEFGEAVIRERERQWQLKKAQEREQTDNRDPVQVLAFAAAKTGSFYARQCAGLVRDLYRGKIDRTEFERRRQILVDKLGKRNCACDNGIVFSTDKDGYRFVYACPQCNLGKLTHTQTMLFGRQEVEYHLPYEPSPPPKQPWMS